MRDRLGIRPPRRRPCRRRREPAGQGPDRRRRRGPRATADPAGRTRREPTGTDTRGHRDLARPAGRGVALHESTRLRDQPDGRGPLPRTPCGHAQAVWPPRRHGAGQHPAHRRRRAPGPARGPSSPRRSQSSPAPSRTLCGTAPGPATSSTPNCASTIRLPRRRRLAQGHPRLSHRQSAAGSHAHPGAGRQAHPRPTARRAQEGRALPRHRRRGRTASRSAVHPADAATAAGRAGHGPPGTRSGGH